MSGKKEFEVVSAQFCLPYFFKTKESFFAILETINNNLRVGGIFMGTMFDGESVKDRLQYPFEDYNYNLVRKSIGDDMYGNTINVLLRDNENSAKIYNPKDEYIVNFKNFCNIMEINGYELIETSMFSKLYKEIFNLNSTEKDVSFLYRYFVFKRKL